MKKCQFFKQSIKYFIFLQVLQFCDFFCSILAFWVTLIAISGISPKFSSTLHMVGVVIIAVGVEYNRTGLLVFIIPVGLGVVIPVSQILLQLFLVGTLR